MSKKTANHDKKLSRRKIRAAGIKAGDSPYLADPGYVQIAPPETDEQLIYQLNMVKGFIGSAVKCILTKEHETAYVLSDRSVELMKQIRQAMEDIPPSL
jgi:hypothetical protein